MSDQYSYENEHDAFGDKCNAIARNCCWTKQYQSMALEDEHAKTLGIALIGNTHLESLGVPMESNLSIGGVQALVNGITQSSVRTLYSTFPYLAQRPPLEVLDIFFSAVSTTIQSLNFGIDPPMSDADASVLCQSFTKVGPTSLQSLSFHHHCLSIHGAHLIAKGLRASNIKQLVLTGYSLDDSTGNVLATLYREGILASSVDDLSLTGSVGDIHALASILHCLNRLTVQRVNFTNQDIQVLSSGLKQPNQIQYLELDECGLDNHRMRMLSIALKDNVVVKTLILSRNSIGDSGVLAFISNWGLHSNLDKIDLLNNCIGQLGAQRLLQASSQRPSLTHLNLSGNTQIGHTGLHLVAQELRYNTSLRNLLLVRVTRWMPEWTKKQKEQLSLSVNLAAESILNGLRCNIHLREFRIDDLKIRWHHCYPSISFFNQFNNCCERSLILRQDMLPPYFWCLLLAKFPFSPSIVFSFLCELPGLILS